MPKKGQFRFVALPVSDAINRTSGPVRSFAAHNPKSAPRGNGGTAQAEGQAEAEVVLRSPPR